MRKTDYAERDGKINVLGKRSFSHVGVTQDSGFVDLLLPVPSVFVFSGRCITDILQWRPTADRWTGARTSNVPDREKRLIAPAPGKRGDRRLAALVWTSTVSRRHGTDEV